MRILFNGYAGSEIGGPQSYAPAFQAAMRARGIDAKGIVLRNLGKPPAHDRLHGGADAGLMRAYELDLATDQVVHGAEPGMPDAARRAEDRVVGILEAEAPKALVLNGFSLANAYLAAAAGRLGIPFFLSHHGSWSAEIPGTLPAAAQERMRAMEAAAIRHARVNVYLNEWGIHQTRAAYADIVRHEDVVIPLPFNPVFAKQAAPTIAPDGRPIVGFVGRWDPIKNISLVRAFAESAKDVRVIAPVRISARTSLRDEEEPFRSAIEVMNPMTQAALAGFYRSCDLLILPSRFDMLGGVVMEAALQGRGTVISENVGWLPAYERLGMEEWISKDPSLESLEAAVRRNLGKPVPAAFRDEVLERNHPDRVFDAWASLLTSCV